MLSDEISKVNLEEGKLKIIKKAIIELERQNIRTSEYSKSEMVKMIKKIIESSVD